METERDDRVMSLVKKSILVNSVKEVMKDEETNIEPIVSLFMLSAAARARKSSFAKLVAEFPDGIQNDEGRPLEWCAYWWLRMRLATAAGKENFCLAKLLGVEEVTFDGSDPPSSRIKKLKEVKFTVPADASSVRTTLRRGKLTSSRNNRTQFFADMGSLVSDTDAIWRLETATGEAWDAMLAVFDTEGKEWFVVFLELKARRNLEDRNQAQHVQVLEPRRRMESGC